MLSRANRLVTKFFINSPVQYMCANKHIQEFATENYFCLSQKYLFFENDLFRSDASACKDNETVSNIRILVNYEVPCKIYVEMATFNTSKPFSNLGITSKFAPLLDELTVNVLAYLQRNEVQYTTCFSKHNSIACQRERKNYFSFFLITVVG